MDKRQIIGVIGAALAATIARPSGAQDRRLAKVGFIGGGAPSDSAASLLGLRDGLRALGYVEPETLSIEARFAEGDLARIQTLIEEIEPTGVQVLVAHALATAPAIRAKRRTPLVFTLSADPVAAGLMTDLAHPRHDATGVTLMAAELNVKRMELLREIAPRLVRVAVLYNPQHGGEDQERGWVDRAARGLGFDVSYFPAGQRPALDEAFSAMRARPPEALLLLSDGFILAHRRMILERSEALRLIVLAGWGAFVEAGALFSYGPRLQESLRRPAYFIDRILRGSKAADLPIERPTVLEFVINLDSAQHLGLTLPPSFIARADHVIG